MSDPTSQMGITPIEPSSVQNSHQPIMDDIVHVEIIIDNQQSLQLNQTNMIPSQTAEPTNDLIRRRAGRRRRRQRRNQRRREQRLQQQAIRQAEIERQRQQRAERQAEIERQRPYQQELRRQRQEQRTRRWEERRQQRIVEKPDHERRSHQDYDNFVNTGQQLLRRQRSFHYYFTAEDSHHEDTDEDEAKERLLTDYQYETMDPTERWHQDILNQLENFVDLQLLAIQQEELEDMRRLNEAEEYGQRTQKERACSRDEWYQAQLNQIGSQTNDTHPLETQEAQEPTRYSTEHR